jgi:DamX protein
MPGYRNAWILQQDPDHFTLQLVAGNNLKTLRDFIRQHPLDGPLAIYHSTRKGKPWFGLIQHDFPSKQDAVNARSQLPESLRKEGPWVRRFAALQKDLQRNP